MIAVAALAVMALWAQQGGPQLLDDFESVAGWSALPSEGVTLKIGRDAGLRGHAMRLDFDFHGGGGYAIARRTLDVALPENYAFSFNLRGQAPPENLELKLIDSTGENVWWSNQRDVVFPAEWTQITRKKRHISFAWGPIGGGEMHRVAAIELVVTAGHGGKGTVWIDELTFTPLEPVRPLTEQSVISGPVLAPDTALTLDLGGTREIGGLTVDWLREGARASDYDVELSDDGRTWRTAHRVRGGAGPRDFIYLPETETRAVRLMARGQRGRDPAVTVQSVPWSATPNDFWRSVAKAAARGTYPKYLTDSVQSYWTVVGVNGDKHEGLLNEDGMLESDAGAFSIEPLLRIGDTLVTWADVKPRQSLEGHALPIPSVEWTRGSLSMTVTAFADGKAGASSLLARYRVSNHGTQPARAELVLAIRPFQVNPPWQFLNLTGGAARIRSLEWTRGTMRVNGDRIVAPLTAPTRAGAASFDAGGVVAALRDGRFPRARSVMPANDSLGGAEGALAYTLDLAAGASRDVFVELPFGATPPRGGDGARRLSQSVATWNALLGAVQVTLPGSAARIAASLRSQLAYVLVNRDGPAIQPGSRSYARSWIRDGSLTSVALLRLGHSAEVREFLNWFARYQYPSGKVPCCVDSRGADPVPEHDSHGEFIFLVAEYYRYTGDRATAAKMWPHVERAVAYIDSLRHEHSLPSEPVPDTSAVRGLMPQSISHEGYSAKPMHSYWDDLFTLRGLKSAAELATALGRVNDARRYEMMRDEFGRDLYASLGLTMAMHHIDFIPGSVELGDFDATSTTIALTPVDELAHLPSAALHRTFERYYERFDDRRAGRSADANYTPYELRVVGSFVRLGWRERAHELLEFFLVDQRPAAWLQWAEVVWRDPATPKFIGDMPHSWVGSDFIRSVLDMLAYEREGDGALVVGAGITRAWVSEVPGVRVRGLRTTHGPLDLMMRAEGDSVIARLSGLTSMPRGGVLVRSPLDRPIRVATVDGRIARVTNTNEVIVEAVPARLVLRY